MQTAYDFVALLLGFVPFLSMVAITLFVFWIATKLIPSLNAWMTSTDGMDETEDDYYESRPASNTFDQYV